jgi:hypothetical protein
MAEPNGEIVETMGGDQLFTGTLAAPDPMQRTQIPAPEGTPAKFWDAEKGVVRTDELLKSYAELEKKFSAPADPPAVPADPAAAPPVTPDPADPSPDPASADPADPDPAAATDPADPADPADTPVAVNLDEAMGNAQKVYAETGALPTEAREPFIKAGFSNEQIDLYLAGVKAYEQGLQQAAVKAAGVQSYDEVVEATKWAAANWNEKQIAAFNSQTGDIDTIGNAVAGLFQAYRAANPAEPGEGRLTGANNSVGLGDVYTREAEFQKDLAAADKARDVDARREAVAKMARSLKAGSIKK